MEGDIWLRRCVVLIIICVSSIIALATIGAAILHPYLDEHSETPSVLEDWGGLIIGFYFGTLVGLLKDWMSDASGKDNGGVDLPEEVSANNSTAGQAPRQKPGIADDGVGSAVDAPDNQNDSSITETKDA